MKNLLCAALLVFASPVLAADCPALLDQQFRPLAGKEQLRLCDQFAGKVLLIVNTASKCGYTRQYEGLEKLHQELSGKGFAVLGFPANDFMGQEPGSEEEIAEFCTLTYGVKFPMFEKTVVSGKDANPLYQQLKTATGEEPGWNFHKYLVGRDGKVIASYPSKVTPESAELRAAIDTALASQ